MPKNSWLGLAFATLAAVGAPSHGQSDSELRGSADRILQHIRVLASDEFEGRAPGSAGEEKTVAYLEQQLKALGLRPGNPDGRYVQDVPLVGFEAVSMTGSFRVGGRTISLQPLEDFVAISRRVETGAKVADSEVVFVGYGVVATEYGWDDYKDVDVRGKTILMLVNDPAVPDPDDPARLDPAFFKGSAMTYYGRWTYKYEIASEKGAAAAVLIHETGPAGYPFEVVTGSWGRENIDVPSADGGRSRVGIESWISLDRAKELAEASGHSLEGLKAAAIRRDFRPIGLGSRADFTVENRSRTIRSRNVVGSLPGSDPELASQAVVFTAHWDHLGRDPKLEGDQIFNGAADNASGVAAMLELARLFTVDKTQPRRSLLFLFVTAEEKGLLGAKHYAEHPLIPLERTVADFNLDVINLWGRTSDLVSVGLGQSTLDDVLIEAARERGRDVGPDAEPEKGMYYRSDHFEFAKQGVPALNLKGGIRYLGKPEEYGRALRDQYTKNDYHKVTDEVKPDWDLTGAAEDVFLLQEVARRVANADAFPEWKPGSEFRERREAALRRAAP